MAHRVVILGAGTGGTLVANRLRRGIPHRLRCVTVLDQDDRHVYQPGLLFVPFGLAHPADVARPHADRRTEEESLDDFRARIREDLEGASASIEAHIGRRPVALAYPFGAYGGDRANDLAIDDIVREEVPGSTAWPSSRTTRTPSPC